VRIQPEEGISLKFLSKRPGAGMKLRPVSMDFNYGSSFGERSPSAYETLLLDAIIGDATLYTRQDMVEASWAVVEPIQNAGAKTVSTFPTTPPEPGDRRRRRHAGAPRPRLEETVMAVAILPRKSSRISPSSG
jgi:glucose-6-phosphate 1-dehydrogenase